MKETAEQKPARREFLRSAGRYLILGGLSTVALISLGKRGRKCPPQVVCRSCTEFAACELPQSLHARAIDRKDTHG